MAEGTHPVAKPVGTNPVVFPATKAQLYMSTQPMYRPQAAKARPPRRRKSGCCKCCVWFTFIFIAIILLAAIAGGVFYLLYRPRLPSFSVSSLQFSTLNVTADNSLTSRLDITVTAINPNKKVVFSYDDISISASTGWIGLGDGSFPGFVHEAKNTTVLKITAASSAQKLDSAAAADLKKKSALPLEIEMETRAGVRLGSLKTKKMGFRVSCSGIDVAVPKGKVPPSASSDISCSVKLRIKIWKWSI